MDDGRLIPHGAITAYRCMHNHLFMVFGPHVWIATERLIVAKPVDHCPCVSHKRMNYHTHEDGRTYYPSDQQVRLCCACGDRTKGPADIKRSLLKAAEAAHLLGGYDAAFRLLDSATAIFRPHKVGTYDHGLPLTFPPGY